MRLHEAVSICLDQIWSVKVVALCGRLFVWLWCYWVWCLFDGLCMCVPNNDFVWMYLDVRKKCDLWCANVRPNASKHVRLIGSSLGMFDHLEVFGCEKRLDVFGSIDLRTGPSRAKWSSQFGSICGQTRPMSPNWILWIGCVWTRPITPISDALRVDAALYWNENGIHYVNVYVDDDE